MSTLSCLYCSGPVSSMPRFGGARSLATVPVKLHIHNQSDAQRSRVESYIFARYAKRFGAVLREWLPTLVTVQLNGEIVAAAGYRGASEPLFLERYLPGPVEQCLPLGNGIPASRERIVEAGQFAATRPGAGRLLIPMLASHLREQGYEWAVTTATQELRRMFVRMGMSPTVLAGASQDALDAEARRDWGSYYAHDPAVVAEYLGQVVGELGME